MLLWRVQYCIDVLHSWSNILVVAQLNSLHVEKEPKCSNDPQRPCSADSYKRLVCEPTVGCNTKLGNSRLNAFSTWHGAFFAGMLLHCSTARADHARSAWTALSRKPIYGYFSYRLTCPSFKHVFDVARQSRLSFGRHQPMRGFIRAFEGRVHVHGLAQSCRHRMNHELVCCGPLQP